MQWTHLLIALAIIGIVASDPWFISRRRRRRRRVPAPPPPRPSPCLSTWRSSTIPASRSIESLRAAAMKWAPHVKLAKGETYNPSSVDFFLSQVTLSGRTYTAQTLPKCNSGCFLKTKQRLSCNSCRLPFFHGENPSQNGGAKVPTYVMVRETSSTTVDFIYWFFYPYNRGKNVCIGVKMNNFCPCAKFWGHCICPRITTCIGGHSTFGHHVGDWEHVIVRFVNNRLYSMYLSIHDSGVTRKYGGEFKWTGSTFRRNDGKTLVMDFCTHARIYSGAGSHGMWPNAGENVYKNLINGERLVDSCSDGVGWQTWKNLKMFKYRQDDNYEGEFSFMRYAGRWGNPKSGCGLVEKVAKECMLNSGPGGPQYKGFVKSGQLG